MAIDFDNTAAFAEDAKTIVLEATRSGHTHRLPISADVVEGDFDAPFGENAQSSRLAWAFFALNINLSVKPKIGDIIKADGIDFRIRAVKPFGSRQTIMEGVQC